MSVTTCCICEEPLGAIVSIPGVTEVVCPKAVCHQIADADFEVQMAEAAREAFVEHGGATKDRDDAFTLGFALGWRHLRGDRAKGPARLPAAGADAGASTPSPAEQKAFADGRVVGRKAGAMEAIHALDQIMAWVPRAPTGAEVAAHEGLWIYQLAPFTEGKYAHVCTPMAVATYAMHPSRWRAVSHELFPVTWPNPRIVSVH